ncbi:hypothetical protein C8A05DRAFT_35325 [Staphylotrichum tortipilum]|uniref:Uncharacterized protein n=1 Tax=Staphylotrichum tortipilum TaxID=2831512 RepID=A0AAN6MJ33_9PEZI|nr:hypothetical protein C8A05DRAFT_35325 [Staphylotrichum longicolle]
MAHPRRPAPAGSSRDRHARADAPSASFWLAPPPPSSLPGLPAQAPPTATIPHRAQPRRRDISFPSPHSDTAWPSSRSPQRRGAFSTGAGAPPSTTSSTGATTGSSYQGSNSGSGGNNDKTKTGSGGGGSSSTPSGSGSGGSSGLTQDNLARTSGYYGGVRLERDAAGEGEGAERPRTAWLSAGMEEQLRKLGGNGA